MGMCLTPCRCFRRRHTFGKAIGYPFRGERMRGSMARLRQRQRRCLRKPATRRQDTSLNFLSPELACHIYSVLKSQPDALEPRYKTRADRFESLGIKLMRWLVRAILAFSL